jgi:hypothetical protein
MKKINVNFQKITKRSLTAKINPYTACYHYFFE